MSRPSRASSPAAPRRRSNKPGLLLALGLLSGAAAASAAQPLVLAELFTSQGCSSCPPADRLMAELAARPEVLALAYHVDYWDYLGWRDTFSSSANTQRQRYYERARGFSVYTPQLVVEGSEDVVGSKRGQVLALIDGAATHQRHAQVQLLRRGPGSLELSVGDSPGAGTKPTATVTLVSYAPRAQTRISAGENAGSQIDYYQIVRSTRSLGVWQGAAQRWSITLNAQESGLEQAVIVQAEDGTVWGIARLAPA